MKNRLFFTVGAVFIATSMGISGCSSVGKIGKSARKMTTFGSQQSTSTSSVAINEKLIIPPSLKTPANGKSKASATPTRSSSRKSAVSNKNYYIIVGTYPDQDQALDTFVRLSSIGLSGATMESRKTKSGKVLHMVRLGPYHNQEKIDKTTDSLTSDGLSQFKVVEN